MERFDTVNGIRREKLGSSPEVTLGFYAQAVGKARGLLEPLYRLHAARVKMLCQPGRYLGIEEDPAQQMAYLRRLQQGAFLEATEEAELGEDAAAVARLEARLWEDCRQGLLLCNTSAPGEGLQHLACYHRARYRLAASRVLFCGAIGGDPASVMRAVREAKDDLAFMFRAPRGKKFEVRMWELDSQWLKYRGRNRGRSADVAKWWRLGGKALVAWGEETEQHRKYWSMVRKSFLLYIKLLRHAGSSPGGIQELQELDAAHRFLRVDSRATEKKKWEPLVDLAPCALGHYTAALFLRLRGLSAAEADNTSAGEAMPATAAGGGQLEEGGCGIEDTDEVLRHAYVLYTELVLPGPLELNWEKVKDALGSAGTCLELSQPSREEGGATSVTMDRILRGAHARGQQPQEVRRQAAGEELLQSSAERYLQRAQSAGRTELLAKLAGKIREDPRIARQRNKLSRDFRDSLRLQRHLRLVNGYLKAAVVTQLADYKAARAAAREDPTGGQGGHSLPEDTRGSSLLDFANTLYLDTAAFQEPGPGEGPSHRAEVEALLLDTWASVCSSEAISVAEASKRAPLEVKRLRGQKRAAVPEPAAVQSDWVDAGDLTQADSSDIHAPGEQDDDGVPQVTDWKAAARNSGKGKANADDFEGQRADDIEGQRADDIEGQRADDIEGQRADDIEGQRSDDIESQRADDIEGQCADAAAREQPGMTASAMWTTPVCEEDAADVDPESGHQGEAAAPMVVETAAEYMPLDQEKTVANQQTSKMAAVRPPWCR
ncbi:hypothetical protein CYMTET_17936 [Cymbomonas tetramitiformis]|uniref:Uncharacterized protein n=1 Tax=Cymbomonas tetramitiformis TaxID=36881 RepID=A0AAE0G942_9CHLO|nr:hypothetical protein CYMTET_17936 [Cymbomonas tetramitiformis]